MVEFIESKFYKALQDFFINNNKETFLQMLGEFYNRTENIINKNDIQDEIIKELRELYISLNEKGIDENIVREKVEYFLENSTRIQNIYLKLKDYAKKGDITSRDFKILNDSDKLGLENLKDEVIQAISGTAPVSPTLMNGVITPQKTTFFKEGKNLFNKNDITINKYLNGENGKEIDMQTYFVSDYITVVSEGTYAFTLCEQIIGYDKNYGFVANLNNSTGIISIPLNCKYVRFASPIESLNKAQVEEGNTKTGYENYRLGIKSELINGNKNDIDGDIFKDNTIDILKLKNVTIGKNIFNKNNITDYMYFGNGTTGTVEGWCGSLLELESNKDYIYNKKMYYSLFDKNMNFISGKTEVDEISSFNTGDNIKFIGIGITISDLDTLQIEVGTISTSYEKFSYTLDDVKIKNENYDRIYSLSDAWFNWSNGEKFPVGFLGDSTTDGAGCSGWTYENGHEKLDSLAGGWGKVDYINEKAYPYLLEKLIQKETGNTNARIYNIGYSGTFLEWAKPKLNEIFGNVYKDVKMVGITYGINDRSNFSNLKDYADCMRNNLEYFIKYFYKKGIQPFLVTSQATVEPYDEFNGTYPLRTSESINTVANTVKRDLAKIYNLEIIERTDFDEHLMTYSSYNMTDIINDTLHFSDKGNELVAGYLFSQFCPRVITIKDSNTQILGFTSQRMKSQIPTKKWETLLYLNPFENGFKIKAKYVKDNSDDITMLDFYILNYSKNRFTVNSYITQVQSQYVEIDENKIVIDEIYKVLGNLDIGLHHIVAKSGKTTNVDFKGFKLISMEEV